jgi:hypothetical protein
LLILFLRTTAPIIATASNPEKISQVLERPAPAPDHFRSKPAVNENPNSRATFQPGSWSRMVMARKRIRKGINRYALPRAGIKDSRWKPRAAAAAAEASRGPSRIRAARIRALALGDGLF